MHPLWGYSLCAGALVEKEREMRALTKRKIAYTLLASVFVFALLAFNVFSIPVSGVFAPYEPVALETSQDEDLDKSQLVSLTTFINQVYDGDDSAIRGLYQDGNFALRVVQQPSNNAAYVSAVVGVATQFSMAKNYEVIGMLAHNYASGRHFFNIEYRDVIQVVYGDGSIVSYGVSEIHSYQALQPNSPHSKFLNLDTGETITATQMFKRVYMGSHHLTLQTCIQQGDIDTWGRLFIIAEPLG